MPSFVLLCAAIVAAALAVWFDHHADSLVRRAAHHASDIDRFGASIFHSYRRALFSTVACCVLLDSAVTTIPSKRRLMNASLGIVLSFAAFLVFWHAFDLPF